MRTVTLELSDETLVTIDEIAANMEVERDEVLRDAIAFYLADYELERKELAEADRQIEAGETISHEEVVSEFESWVSSVRVKTAA